MKKSIFFSWQLDTSAKIGKGFIRDVLDEACLNISSDTNIDEPLRNIEVDSDTQGVAGQPPVVDTIFKKINEAAIFVADLTFVSKRHDGRPSPNPNVLIEYGWALKTLGYERVIFIMNSAYGEPTRENLPFDLGHFRFPIRYNLPEGASSEVQKKVRKDLVSTLQKAISTSLATIPEATDQPIPEFPAAIAKDGPARFRNPNEALGFYEDWGWDSEAKEVFLSSGPAMWLRVIPKVIPNKKWTTKELTELSKNNSNYFQPLINGTGWNPLRAEDGIGVYRPRKDNDQLEKILTDSVAFIFETGEIWAIEKGYIVDNKSKHINQTELENIFTKGLENYTKLLGILGIDSPYKWEAGIYGLKGKYLYYPPPPGKMWLDNNGPVCATDEIVLNGEYNEKQSYTSSLMPFFEKIFQKCNRVRPDYLPQ